MEPSALFNTANSYFVNEEYKESLKHYTCAITLAEDVAEYRVSRAAAYLKLGQSKEALEDAQEALKLQPSNHVALQRKGVALFYEGQFGAAKEAFEQSLAANATAELPRKLWLRKCDAELSGSTLPLQGITSEMVTPPSGVKIAPAAASSEASGYSPPAAASSTPAQENPAVPDSGSAQASCDRSISGRKKIKHEWYQSNTHVFITIFAKKIPEENCKMNFSERELEINIQLPGDEKEEFQLDLQLFDAVVVSGCSFEASAVKVEVSLQKASPGVHWGSLEKADPVTDAEPKYPTSQKTKRDWSQVDRDLTEEMKNEKPEGDEALNKLFREIYDRADDDTRRAMNKSFQTSGGTVLSTNWGEVASNDYEGKDRPTAPEGQEWRDQRNK